MPQESGRNGQYHSIAGLHDSFKIVVDLQQPGIEINRSEVMFVVVPGLQVADSLFAAYPPMYVLVVIRQYLSDGCSPTAAPDYSCMMTHAQLS